MGLPQFGIGNELGELRQIEDEEAKPWEKKKTDIKLTRSDVPNEIHITKANMLYIESKLYNLSNSVGYIINNPVFKCYFDDGGHDNG